MLVILPKNVYRPIVILWVKITQTGKITSISVMISFLYMLHGHFPNTPFIAADSIHIKQKNYHQVYNRICHADKLPGRSTSVLLNQSTKDMGQCVCGKVCKQWHKPLIFLLEETEMLYLNMLCRNQINNSNKFFLASAFLN